MGEQFKKLEKMRKEVAKMETKRDQDVHQLTRLENKIGRVERISRTQRTHLLCSKAGYIEALFPEIKDASKADFIQFCDGLMKIPGVKEYARKFKPKPIEEVIQ